MPVLRQGGRRSSGLVFRADLGFAVRSMWEANILRYLHHLVDTRQIAGLQYEHQTLLMPRANALEGKGNAHISLDYGVTFWYPPNPILLPPPFESLANLPLALTSTCYGTFPVLVESKGYLPQGGWLPVISKEALQRIEKRGDPDSRIRLERLRGTKAYTDRIIFCIGEAEYAIIRRVFKARCLAWEGD